MQFLYLGGVIHEDDDLMVEIERRARFTRARYKRFDLELYDVTAAPPSLKLRMLKADVIETLLYGCGTWTPNTIHHDKLRKAHLEVLRRVLGFQRRANHTNLSYAKALKKTKCESIETTIRKRRLFFARAMVRHNTGQLPRRMIIAQVAGGKNPGPGGGHRTTG